MYKCSKGCQYININLRETYMTHSLSKGVGGGLLIGLGMSLLLGGCTDSQEKGVRHDPIARVTVNSDGRFQLLDADGKLLPRCQLCNEKLQ